LEAPLFGARRSSVEEGECRPFVCQSRRLACCVVARSCSGARCAIDSGDWWRNDRVLLEMARTWDWQTAMGLFNGRDQKLTCDRGHAGSAQAGTGFITKPWYRKGSGFIVPPGTPVPMHPAVSVDRRPVREDSRGMCQMAWRAGLRLEMLIRSPVKSCQARSLTRLCTQWFSRP